MNKRGFTLVELLAVVIIVSLLVVIAIPFITNSVNNFSGKTNKLTISMIKEATKLYIDDNINNYPKNVNNSYCITLNKLIENDYLKGIVEIEGEDVTNKKSMQVLYNNGYEIEMVDKNDCVDYREICKPVTSETKTTGSIPSEEIKIGDEYLCEVKENTVYHFFVLSITNNKVNLILDRNINSDGTLATSAINKTSAVNAVYSRTAWITQSDYIKANTDGTSCSYTACNDEGPITAMKFLKKATLTWNNIIDIDETYKDEEGNYGKLELKDKVRLPKKSELSNVGCNGSNVNSCPLWISNYLRNYASVTGEGLQNIAGMNGYWAMSSSNNTYKCVDCASYYIFYNGSLGNTTEAYQTTWYGIRPVISLPKNYLTN